MISRIGRMTWVTAVLVALMALAGPATAHHGGVPAWQTPTPVEQPTPTPVSEPTPTPDVTPTTTPTEAPPTDTPTPTLDGCFVGIAICPSPSPDSSTPARTPALTLPPTNTQGTPPTDGGSGYLVAGLLAIGGLALLLLTPDLDRRRRR